jgi:cobalt/nickel transport system permease protein
LINIYLVDPYFERASFMHRVDPRLKLALVLLLIFFLVLSPPGSWLVFGLYGLIVFSLILLAGLPAGSVLKRSLLVMPFVFLVAVFVPFFKEGETILAFPLGSWEIKISYEGLIVFGSILCKAWLSLLGLIWLTSTTRITDLLNALRRLHFPRLLVMIISFMYRYIFVIIDEMLRIKQARDSRSCRKAGLKEIRNLGNLIGALFIRSYERSERVYSAMLARGFDGQNRAIDSLSLKRTHVVFAVSLTVILASTGIINLVLMGS